MTESSSPMPLSPVDVEAKLRSLINATTRAQQDLAKARDHETECEIALRRARLVAVHDAACPVVARGGPTVADREAFIDEQTLEQWAEHRRTVTARETCADALRTNVAIGSAVQSLNASVRQAYALAGVG